VLLSIYTICPKANFSTSIMNQYSKRVLSVKFFNNYMFKPSSHCYTFFKSASKSWFFGKIGKTIRKNYYIRVIPLRAKQVSEANLRSKQGGINFTPFVLSLPYANKKKKIKISHLDGGQLKNVCLSVVCLSSVFCL
jgi:hypothetical protein